MREKRGFFEKIQDKIILQIVFFLLSMSVILVVYVFMGEKIQQKKLQEYVVIEERNLIKCIEDVQINKRLLNISGWCFLKNVDSNKQNIQVFLKEIEDENEIIWLDVERVEREDIAKYYNFDVDYSQAGFIASTRIKGDQYRNFEIFVKINYSEEVVEIVGDKEVIKERQYTKTVSTQHFICNGQLTSIKPGEGLSPQKTNSEVINGILDGRLLAYQNDFDMYVYQSDDYIYWVAGKEFEFAEDGKTVIQFQLDTTRVSSLPEERVNNGWHWDNCSFVFEEKELRTEDSTPYRVACYKIPEEYPITYFWTGQSVGNRWKWVEYLNLDVKAWRTKEK